MVIIINYILNFVLGLVLFLFGMNVIETGLRNISGNRLTHIIEKASDRTIAGVIIGTVITAVLQSSSAVTVIIVGAVDSGLLRLKNAVGIIMGANIGTSVTAWIISLSDSDLRIQNNINPINLYPLAGLVGIGFIILFKNIKLNNIGIIVMGLTLITAGIKGMCAAVSPLGESEGFIRFLTAFDNPLLGILSGAVTSAVMQSSSASIGVLQALSNTGKITFLTAVPIILGQNIGTCVTAGLACVGSGRNAKKTAAAHFAFNEVGVLIWTIALLIIKGFLTDFVVDPVTIAMIHTLFNTSNAAILTPFIILYKKGARCAHFATHRSFCAAETERRI